MTPPTIDLSTCEPGDRVRLRDGRRGKYKGYKQGWYVVKHKGGFWWYRENEGKTQFPTSIDIVAILGPSIWERVRRWIRRRTNANIR